MLFCCLWCNIEISFHKHFVIISRHQQTPLLTTSDKCHNLPWFGGTMLITPGSHSVGSMRWSQILVENCKVCLSHLHSTPMLRAVPVGILPWRLVEEKLEWFGYPLVKKIWRYDRIHECDRQTDTKWQHRPRLHSIARQKCQSQWTYYHRSSSSSSAINTAGRLKPCLTYTHWCQASDMTWYGMV